MHMDGATPAIPGGRGDDSADWPSPARAWWVVVVFGLALTLSLADRLVIALMIEPIKLDLGLSDTEIGLIHGLAFTILYVFAGLPLGRVADRWNRKALSAISVLVWSVMTALCGVANSFGQLFAARLGVGVGEAGLSPAAVSAISDYFPRHKRARALTFLTIGTTAGAGLAMMFGGLVIQAVGSSGSVDVPILGVLRGWQMVFLALGLFGILFAAIFLTVREPVRREQGNGNASVGDVMRFVWMRRAFLSTQFLGASFGVLVLIGFHSWVPTLFIRRLGWDATSTGLVYGGCVALGGLTGILIAGSLVSRLAARGCEDAHLRIATAAAGMAALPLIVAPLLPSATVMVALLFVGFVGLSIVPALAPAALQSVCSNEMRGQVFGIYMFVMSFLGYALGPLAVAMTTDFIFQDEQQLHLSLSLVAGIFLPLAGACLFLATRFFHLAGARNAAPRLATPAR